jgi:hypothetical protein
MGTKFVVVIDNRIAQKRTELADRPHAAQAPLYGRSAVQSRADDLADAERVRLSRLMANPERDHSERDRALGMLTATITVPKRPPAMERTS